MKRQFAIPFLLCSAAAASLVPATAQPSPGKAYATDREIHLYEDFDGTGRAEPVIVDRATGLYRFARRDEEGLLQWEETRSTGLPAADSASPGLFRSSGGGEFVVVHRDANRIAFVAPAADPVLAHPVVVPSPRPGPLRVAAGFYHEKNESGRHDLSLLTAYNRTGPAVPAHRLDFLSATPDPDKRPVLDPLDDVGISLEQAGGFETVRHPALATDILLLTGDAEILGPLTGYFLRGDDADTAVQYIGSAATRFEAADLFAGPAEPSLIIWRRGEPIVQHAVLRTSDGINGTPLEFFLQEDECPLPHGVEMLVLLEDGTDPARILVIATNAREAFVYPIFDGCPGEPLDHFPAPEGDAFLGALPDGDGGFTLFTGRPGGASTGYRDFQREGDGSYILRSEGRLPELNERLRFPNLIGFDRHPLLVPEASAFEYYRYRDWTVAGGVASDTVEAVGEAFLGESEGLGQPSKSVVGPAVPGVGFLLPNQVAADISVAALAPAGAHTPDSVSVVPGTGTYNRTVRLAFSTGMPDGKVLYQIGTSGEWRVYDPDYPPSVFRDATVRFFARSVSEPERMTAVRTATYAFLQPFHRFDANRDDVPDFVRAHHGLDPFGQADTSGNGITDFEAILLGIDPFDPDADAAGRRLDFGLVFDANVYPIFPHPKEPPETETLGAVPGLLLETHNLRPNRTGSARVGTAPSVIGAPAGARFERLDPAGGRLFFTASTPAIFDTDPEFEDWRGHELLGLFAAPALELPVIEYTPSGLSLADEAENWRKAALEALEGHERSVVDWEIRPESTFVLALMERELARLLAGDADGGEPEPHTLVPHRRGDSGRQPFTREKIESLTRPAPGARELDGPLYDLFPGRDAIAAAVAGSGTSGEAVRALVYDVYRVRAQHHNPQLADLPRPLDAFRHFLGNGGALPDEYAARTGLDASELDAAYQGAVAIADGAFPERQARIRSVEILPDTFDDPCRNVIDTGRGDPLQLVDPRGEPYRFPSSLRLPAGTRLEISGFSDAAATAACGDEPFEVLAVHLVFLPTPAGDDTDGNLLPEEWESAYFGENGVDPFGDTNGNGYSNLQHYLAGADPLMSGPIPGVEPADLSPPTVEIRALANGDFELIWEYPSGYADWIGFRFEQSTDLVQWTPLEPENKTQTAPGRWEATIAGPDGNGAEPPFYRLRMELN